MIILGIDPGIASTGWGVISFNKSKFECLDYGVIKTLSSDTQDKRLFQIHHNLSKIIEKYSPVYAGMEELFFAKNKATAFFVAEARGVLLFTLYKYGVKVKQLTPIQIKQSLTGFGRSDKLGVQNMVKIILGLEKIPTPDHCADALASAIVAKNFIDFEDKITSV